MSGVFIWKDHISGWVKETQRKEVCFRSGG
jgi:hypothetical protein